MPQWILSKTVTFEAAHRLPFHDGKCQRLHGHSWKMTVYVGGDSLVSEGAKQGMLIDYADIKKHLEPLVKNKLDHWFLNETLGIESPTSEEVARWVYSELKAKLPILAVQINETCTSSCFYSEHQLNLSGFNSILG